MSYKNSEPEGLVIAVRSTRWILGLGLLNVVLFLLEIGITVLLYRFIIPVKLPPRKTQRVHTGWVRGICLFGLVFLGYHIRWFILDERGVISSFMHDKLVSGWGKAFLLSESILLCGLAFKWVLRLLIANHHYWQWADQPVDSPLL